jgi:hypothetical protein
MNTQLLNRLGGSSYYSSRKPFRVVETRPEFKQQNLQKDLGDVGFSIESITSSNEKKVSPSQSLFGYNNNSQALGNYDIFKPISNYQGAPGFSTQIKRVSLPQETKFTTNSLKLKNVNTIENPYSSVVPQPQMEIDLKNMIETESINKKELRKENNKNNDTAISPTEGIFDSQNQPNLLLSK